MDITKIISDSFNKHMSATLDGEFNRLNDYPQLSDSSKDYAILMNYSETLLKTYHEELKRELANHGIRV